MVGVEEVAVGCWGAVTRQRRRRRTASARAVVGMYGDLGSIGLTGPRGKLEQFRDLPDNAEVVGLFNQGKYQ